MTPKPWKPFVVRGENSKVYHKPAPLTPGLDYPNWWLTKYRTAACMRTSGLICDETEERKLRHRRCQICFSENRRTE